MESSSRGWPFHVVVRLDIIGKHSSISKRLLWHQSIDPPIRKHNLSPSLETNIQKRRKETQLIALFIILLSGRKIFFKVFGGLHIGIVNRVLPCVYLPMTLKRHDGKHPR